MEKDNSQVNVIPSDVKKDRINSIDIFKGISIFWIIAGHTANNWLRPDSIWMYDILYIFFFSAITSVCFVWLSGLNISISVLSKKDAGWSYKDIYIHTLKRIGVLAIFAVIYNLIMAFIIEGFANFQFCYLFAWHILQLLTVGIILSLFLLRINKYLRFLIGCAVIGISHPLHAFLFGLGSSANIIDYLLFYPYNYFPLLPWAGVVFIGCVIGEFFYSAKYSKKTDSQNKGNNSTMMNFIKYSLLLGILSIFLAIILGYQPPTPDTWYWWTFGALYAGRLSTNPLINLINLPYMFLVGHWTYFFYSIGIVLIILAVLTYISDVKNKKSKVFDIFSFAGKFAFSIFLFHHLGLPLFLQTFDYFWIWPVWISYAILNILFVWVLVRKFKGVGTIEWLIAAVTRKKDN